MTEQELNAFLYRAAAARRKVLGMPEPAPEPAEVADLLLPVFLEIGIPAVFRRPRATQP